eukprot:2709559-Amphidinium_carterae.1
MASRALAALLRRVPRESYHEYGVPRRKPSNANHDIARQLNALTLRVQVCKRPHGTTTSYQPDAKKLNSAPFTSREVLPGGDYLHPL